EAVSTMSAEKESPTNKMPNGGAHPPKSSLRIPSSLIRKRIRPATATKARRDRKLTIFCAFTEGRRKNSTNPVSNGSSIGRTKILFTVNPPDGVHVVGSAFLVRPVSQHEQESGRRKADDDRRQDQCLRQRIGIRPVGLPEERHPAFPR